MSCVLRNKFNLDGLSFFDENAFTAFGMLKLKLFLGLFFFSRFE